MKRRGVMKTLCIWHAAAAGFTVLGIPAHKIL